MGKLLAINISKERGTEKREVPQAELVADYGIMGDAHAGKWHRQGLTTSYDYRKHTLLWHNALAHPLVYGTMRMALLAYLRHLKDGISYAKACTKRQIS